MDSRVEGPAVRFRSMPSASSCLQEKQVPRLRTSLASRMMFSARDDRIARELSPLPLLHHLRKFLEQIMRIMRPGRGFRVILHAEQRQIPMPQAFERLVVQINVRQLNFAVGQRVWIDGEVMVVRRDLDLSGLQLLHRMILAVIAILLLEIGRASCTVRWQTTW